MTPTTSNPAPTRDREAWRRWYDDERLAVDRLLDAHLARLTRFGQAHSQLHEAFAYSLQQSGKRLRPILVREAARICGAAADAADAPAVAVECIHTFSLIHDDLPAMDDDDLRRGQPTNHRVFGEALAILAGDWLVAYAFRLLASAHAPDVTQRLLEELGDGSLAMVEGQAADIAGEQKATEPVLVQYIHQRKTAALISTCCRLGAIAAQAPEESIAALGEYGRRVGLAFQIVDDLLDHTGSTEQLGKRAGKDAAVSKQTYPAAFGVDASRAAARREVGEAVAALAPWGADADHLRRLAEFVLDRDR